MTYPLGGGYSILGVPYTFYITLILKSKLSSIMKKGMEKKLSLGKIKIAKLSNAAQDAQKPTYTGCSLALKCIPPTV